MEHTFGEVQTNKVEYGFGDFGANVFVTITYNALFPEEERYQTVADGLRRIADQIAPEREINGNEPL